MNGTQTQGIWFEGYDRHHFLVPKTKVRLCRGVTTFDEIFI